MIRISLVSYCNTIPFKTALDESAFIKDNAVINECFPAQCAKDLYSDLADIALVPIGALERFDKYEIITDYCIAANKKVESVLLLSESPNNKIDEVLLDYQSRTSVKLIKVINSHYWKFNLKFIDASKGFENSISGKTAAVIIGDRALALRNKYPFVYDLAEEWYKFTGLAAVFAVWVAKRGINKDFITKFNDILADGNKNKAKIAKRFSHLYDGFELEDYLVNCIDFCFDHNKRKSMDKFLMLSKNV